MILGRSVLALVLARGGSKRLPGKNVRPLAGKPLIGWTIDCALAVGGIDRVLVSTDSPEIAAVARACGADVPWLRPAELATDAASSNDAIRHALGECSARGERYDMLVLLQPTTPFRDPAEVRRGIEMSVAAGGAPVVAMAPASPHPAWCFTVDAEGFARPFGDGSGLRARSQDLPVAYSLTGSLYVMGIADFLREETFFTPATRALVTETPLHAIDIDDKFDWLVAEAFANQVRPLEQP